MSKKRTLKTVTVAGIEGRGTTVLEARQNAMTMLEHLAENSGRIILCKWRSLIGIVHVFGDGWGYTIIRPDTQEGIKWPTTILPGNDMDKAISACYFHLAQNEYMPRGDRTLPSGLNANDRDTMLSWMDAIDRRSSCLKS